MDKQKKPVRPALSSQKPVKPVESPEKKLRKIQLFFQYRLPSLYRQLKRPIYDDLLKKPTTSNKSINSNKNIPNIDTYIEMLYKKVTLNSKYHHREKMRFSRMPIIKYLKYDYLGLQERLKSKAYNKMYDDLEEQDEEDEPLEKKQYEVDPHFNQQALKKYKRKHGINGLIVSSYGYEDMKQRLISKYGWTENPDVTSLYFDYKHMSKKKDIDYVNLLDQQGVNHFNENKAITAKFGLTRNLRNLAAMGKDMGKFFPRCYDVNDVSEFENFYESFKETFVEMLLKDYLRRQGKVNEDIIQLSNQIIRRCVEYVERRFMPIDKKIVLVSEGQQLFIGSEEFEEMQKYRKLLKKSDKEQKAKAVNEQLLEAVKAVDKLASENDPQWKINQDNIWIVKPASLSRGRGIKTFDNVVEIMDYVIGKQISWVVQKYIQNPLVIRRRKFDIRQWVLLTDFKPFRVWGYDECYIRFCATEYTPENLKDRKVHLTNNSVTKGVSDILGDGIEENMVCQNDFIKMLQEIAGKDVFSEMIRPQMDKIAVQALESVKENIVGRQNTMEVFGFDFMVDEEFRVWLIEVNSSPTMEYSTKVTTNIVQRGMSDYGDLVNNYLFGGKQYKKKQAEELYGGWRLLTE